MTIKLKVKGVIIVRIKLTVCQIVIVFVIIKKIIIFSCKYELTYFPFFLDDLPVDFKYGFVNVHFSEQRHNLNMLCAIVV